MLGYSDAEGQVPTLASRVADDGRRGWIRDQDGLGTGASAEGYRGSGDQLVRLLDKLFTDQRPNFPVSKAVILTMLVGVEVLLKIVFCFQKISLL